MPASIASSSRVRGLSRVLGDDLASASGGGGGGGGGVGEVTMGPAGERK